MKISPLRISMASTLAALLVSIGGLNPLAFGAPGVVSPDPDSRAAASEIDTGAPTELIIHKRLQPDDFGPPATGQEDSSVQGAPVAGVAFSATMVPGIDLTTSEGWEAARSLSVGEAIQLTAAEEPQASRTTDAEGIATLPLGVGLYLVQETASPAEIVPSSPFLVPLPLAEDGQWNYSVHIYPKNAAVDATLSVNDRSAVTCQDSVQWTSSTAIPRQQALDEYVVQNLVAPGLTVQVARSAPEIQVTLVGTQVSLVADDFGWQITTVEGLEAIQVTFTQSGLEKLTEARAGSPEARVEVRYSTRVLEPGVHQNEVRVQAGNAGLVSSKAETRFGPLIIEVRQKGNPQRRIEGAVFELYISAQDAAARQNPVTIDGASSWTTNANGQITFPCLRASNFVNGLDVAEDDPDFRFYFAKPVSYPKGWVGDMEPIAGVVLGTGTAEAQVLQFDVEKEAPGPTPKPEPAPKPGPQPSPLPITGARIGGAGLLSAVLLVGGIALLRRRREGGSHGNLPQ